MKLAGDVNTAQSASDRHWFAISSQKGGVGKTTTCLSLGAMLAEMGFKVLLIDLDPQAHLTQALGLNPESLRLSVGDALLMQASLTDVSRETNIPNLEVAPANRGLILVEKMLHNTTGYEFRLQRALEANGVASGEFAYYDVVLCDCPPSFAPLTINALAACSMVIIPVTCDFFSMQSLNAYLRLLAILRQNINTHIEQRLLITLFDSRTRLSRLFAEQYHQKFSECIFQSQIPLDARLKESALFARPINLYAAKSRSAEEYRALARELMLCQKMTI
jgi:chromosome partitioning protein